MLAGQRLARLGEFTPEFPDAEALHTGLARWNRRRLAVSTPMEAWTAELYDNFRMARLEDVKVTADAPPVGSIQTVVDEAMLILPIAAIIDLDKERQRLQKEIERLQSDIKKIDQKLENEQFVQNAPPEVVEEQKTRRSEAEGVLGKLSAALKQLAAA